MVINMKDGTQISNYEGIKIVAHKFYKNLFTRHDEADDYNTEVTLEHIPPMITENEN